MISITIIQNAEVKIKIEGSGLKSLCKVLSSTIAKSRTCAYHTAEKKLKAGNWLVVKIHWLVSTDGKIGLTCVNPLSANQLNGQTHSK